MSTSVGDLKRWFKVGVEMKHSHMIVVCDTFDYDDYPVYVHPKGDENPGELAREEVRKMDGVNMQKVMEVYDLRKPMEEQMSPHKRVWNYD